MLAWEPTTVVGEAESDVPLALVNGIRLRVEVDGPQQEPAVVLANSLGTDLRMWDPQLFALTARFRVVRFDARGHGASAAPDGPYSIGQLGEDLVGVLDYLGLERVHVCGLSLGGLVAMWAAAHHPERIARAVYANTAAKVGTPELWAERAALAREQGMAAVREVVLPRFFSDGYRRKHPEVVDAIGATLESTPAGGYAASCLALAAADLRPVVGRIRAPALVLAGSEDVATPRREAEWLVQQIPDSELVVLDGAAHLSNIEQPDRFNEAVLSFLTG